MTMAGNSRLLRTIPVLITICLLSLPAYAKYSGGTGEPNDPYQIATAADLMLLGETPEDYDQYFILTADIDLDPNLPGRKVFDRAVIAPDMYPHDTRSDFQGTAFTGVFDGNAHTVSHLTVTGESHLGLFGQVSGRGVRDLGLVDVNITGSGSYVGGLVGSKGGIVARCYSAGAVRGKDNVGGLVGSNGYGSVTQCYSTAAVSGTSGVGGLVGYNGEEGSVTDCYSTCMVSGTGWFVGGLVGDNGGGSVTECFWDMETSCLATSDGGTGTTTAKMQTASTFLEAGWDFVGETANGTEDIWWILEGKDYPRLRWELTDDPSAAMELTITSPIPDERFVAGEEIHFGVAVSRRLDPDGSQLNWTSNKDGDLGTGLELTLDNLSTGSHAIQVCGYGVCASTSVRVYKDLWELYRSPPAESEIARILTDFNFNLIDGDQPDEKWDAYDLVFDQNSPDPSFLVAISKIDVMRHQRFSSPLPFTNGQTLYDHIKTYVNTINLKLDCGNASGGGGTVNLRRSFSVWDGRTGGTATNPDACKTPIFALPSLHEYINPIYLLVHEGRHCEPDDPRHKMCDGRPKDETLEGGSGYAWSILYLMWVYKYGLYDPPFIRNEARSQVVWFLPVFFCSTPTHSDPRVQAIIDEFEGIIPTPPPPEPTPDAGPVGWWKLDEGSGTIAHDSSGHGNDGIIRGDTHWVSGRIGNALEFDGSGDYVDTGYSTDLPIWAVCAWVKSPRAPSADAPSGPVHRERNYQLNWNHTNPIFRGAAVLNVAGTWYAASFGSLEANTWYHLVATYDNQTLKSYKNGSLISSNPAPSGNPRPETATLKFARHAVQANYFTGTMDDLRVYRKALTGEEIQAIMAGTP